MCTTLFKLFSPRLVFSLILIFCLAVLGYALYAQHYQGVDPCPLCIAQRVVYATIGVSALIALINNCKTWGNSIYALIILLVAGAGAKIAHHHVWLQSLPKDQWPASCGMPLNVLFKQIPLTGFIKTVLSGTAECALVNWKIFGFSGPLVSMYGFILLAVAGAYLILQRCVSMCNS